jgi:alkanesulfonate monooxygenase SsuD/methylene tetrahydromethanopterin reductase-like flavin-dependent oxidoreductase (luciferase family)
MRGFWDEMRRLRKEPNPYRAGFLQFVGVAETRAEAMRLYREPAEYFYGRCLHVDPRFAMPPGYASEATQRARVRSQIAQVARRAAERSAPGGAAQRPRMEEIVERGYLVVGGPDEVAEQLRRVALELNVGHLMLLLQFGNMDRQLATHNTELFAKRVMPQLATLFDDAWQDEWWPRPLAPAERSAPRNALR